MGGMMGPPPAPDANPFSDEDSQKALETLLERVGATTATKTGEQGPIFEKRAVKPDEKAGADKPSEKPEEKPAEQPADGGAVKKAEKKDDAK